MMDLLHKNLSYLIESGKISAEKLLSIPGVTLKKIKKESIEDISTWIKISAIANITLDTLFAVDLKKKSAVQKQKIKLLCLDIDGVLTDGGMYYTEAGDEFKKFNTKDGVGIKLLVKKGVTIAFLSNGKNNKLITSRAKLLGVEKVYVGNENKMVILSKWLKELKLTPKQVAYAGDDINDIDVIKNVGFSACPSDAIEEIKKNVNIILKAKGGDACVRELIDNYLL